MRKLYWYFTAYVRKHGWVVVLSLVGATLLFSLLIPKLSTLIALKKRTYIGLVGAYTITDLPEEISEMISGGLTTINLDGSPEPQLAERWSVSSDGTKYRYILRENVVWQDGKPLTPSDITYQFPEVAVETTDATIEYQLPAPYAPFPTTTTDPLLRYEEDSSWGQPKQSVIGIGTTRLLSYTESQGVLEQVVLDSQDERYIFRFYPTETEAVAAFKKGQVDRLPRLAGIYDVFAWENVSFEQVLDTQTYIAAFFNTADPKFNTNIRQALNYAAQKPPSSVRAYGPISRDSWAYLTGLKGYNQDYDRAVERLLEGIPPVHLDITIKTPSLLIDQAEQLKLDWEELGRQAVVACEASNEIDDKLECEKVAIAVNIQVSNYLQTDDFEVLLAAQRVPPDPDQYTLWHSEQATNFTNFKNTRIDKLLEEGRQLNEQRRRIETYQEFQQFFVDESPAVFLEYLAQYQLERI